MEKIIKYKHHDQMVFVRESVKGKHREYCLCWKCAKFFPGELDINCFIAKRIFKLCVDYELVLPVWECPIFEESEAVVTQGRPRLV